MLNSLRLLAVLATICPFCLTADTLSSVTASRIGFARQGILPSQLPLQFALAGDSPTGCWVPSASCIVLLDQVLTLGDNGSTFVFGSSNAGFASAAKFLTDGVGGAWSFSVAGIGGGAAGIGTGPGLPGDTISEIDLTVNNLVFSQVQLPTSFFPLEFAIHTRTQFDATITVLGSQVPEPRFTLLLAALFLAAASFRLSRRRSGFQCFL